MIARNPDLTIAPARIERSLTELEFFSHCPCEMRQWGAKGERGHEAKRSPGATLDVSVSGETTLVKAGLRGRPHWHMVNYQMNLCSCGTGESGRTSFRGEIASFASLPHIARVDAVVL